MPSQPHASPSHLPGGGGDDRVGVGITVKRDEDGLYVVREIAGGGSADQSGQVFAGDRRKDNTTHLVQLLRSAPPQAPSRNPSAPPVSSPSTPPPPPPEPYQLQIPLEGSLVAVPLNLRRVPLTGAVTVTGAEGGVGDGDELTHVDGVAIEGKSDKAVIALLLGQAGSKAQLTLKSGGVEYRIMVERRMVERPGGEEK